MPLSHPAVVQTLQPLCMEAAGCPDAVVADVRHPVSVCGSLPVEYCTRQPAARTITCRGRCSPQLGHTSSLHPAKQLKLLL